jgi:pyridoxamine 5'-phosphate oxidase family protein
MSVFTEKELEYLTRTQFPGGKGAPRLGRIATVGKDGTPHAMPVGFSYNPELDAIEVAGFNNEQTKKYRDAARSGRAALVADDLISTDPWKNRGIEVRGRAEVTSGERPLIRIYPERIVAWGLDGEGTRGRPAQPVTVQG